MADMNLLGQALEPIIAQAVMGEMSKLDIEGQIKDLLAEVAQNTSKVLEVKLQGEDGEGRKFPLVHKQFEDLLAVGAIAKMNPLLTGGAGLAKTTAVMQFAEALELDFKSISFSNQTTKTDLYGFVDANGNYRTTGFVDAFENGKVFLGDEIDACSANVLVLLNSALDNGFLTTADDRTLYMHDNFRMVATANTNLRGAKDGFTARNKLDAATTDRFTIIEWTLDEDLEQKITDNDSWLDLVRRCRINAEHGLEGVVITPRASYKGATLLKAGLDIDKVIQMVIVKAMSEDERDVVLAGITENMKSKAIKDSGNKRAKVEPKEEPEPELEEMGDEDVETFEEAKQSGDDEDEDFSWN